MLVKKIPKEAQCIRDVSSWSHVSPDFKFDNTKFNKENVKLSMELMSPKMTALFKKIEELDKEDLKDTGKLYKHIIYSDVSGVYGAKMVASSFIANGFENVYDNKLKIKNTTELEHNKFKNFALLTSSVVYSKPLTVRLKKNILEKINSRPDNIYGKNIRFLIIDQGFKEGIDVFDVKYLHMLDPVITKAEQTQIIGRGTRFCGQMGLPFDKEYGWKLNVFRYNMAYDDTGDVFQLYLKHTNINLSTINFTAELEDLLIASAADTVLTENIHNYKNLTSNRFKTFIENYYKPVSVNKKYEAPVKKDLIIENVYGKIYTNQDKLDCKQGCSGPLQAVPVGLLLISMLQSQLYKVKDNRNLHDVFQKKHPKPFLCMYVSKDASYCKIINNIWKEPIKFLNIYGQDILKQMNVLKRGYKISDNNYDEMIDFLKKYKSDLFDKPVPKVIYDAPSLPPLTKLPYNQMQIYIKKHFGKFIWPQIEIKNLCAKQSDELEDNSSTIVDFTLTQDFIRKFFIPDSPYKGLLLYHSVGTGKTCTGIATASSSFQRRGYTILWVTRHTLKEDLWKNMFDKICNTVIQEDIIKNKKTVPKERSERMKLLGDNWIQPVSYKQFANMIQGKNIFYQKMVSINGKEDPFKKTLIIIDEVHKIYSSDLKSLEKPDPAILKNMIQSSYEKSGKDSARLLLMTATPITDDPLSAIKILNLIIPKEDHFPEDLNVFMKEFCNENGIFTQEGILNFIDKASGYISYLNRSGDLRQFAYPVIKNILVDITTGNGTKKEDVILLEEKISELNKDKPSEIKTKDKQEKAKNKEEILKHKENLKKLKDQLKFINKSGKEDFSVKAMINKCLSVKGAKKIKEPKEPKEKKEKEPKEKKEKVPKEKKEKVPKEKKEKIPKDP